MQSRARSDPDLAAPGFHGGPGRRSRPPLDVCVAAMRCSVEASSAEADRHPGARRVRGRLGLERRDRTAATRFWLLPTHSAVSMVIRRTSGACWRASRDRSCWSATRTAGRPSGPGMSDGLLQVPASEFGIGVEAALARGVATPRACVAAGWRVTAAARTSATSTASGCCAYALQMTSVPFVSAKRMGSSLTPGSVPASSRCAMAWSSAPRARSSVACAPSSS